MFGDKVKNVAEYDKENKLDMGVNKLFNAYIQILEPFDINLNNDDIRIIFEDMECLDSYWGGDINNFLKEKLKDIIDIDFNKERKNFDYIISNETIHGIMTIRMNWEEAKIQINSVARIFPDLEMDIELIYC